MRDGAKTVPADGIDQEPFLLQGRDDRRWSQTVTDHLEDDDVRIDVLGAELDRLNLLQLSRQPLGMVMVRF